MHSERTLEDLLYLYLGFSLYYIISVLYDYMDVDQTVSMFCLLSSNQHYR